MTPEEIYTLEKEDILHYSTEGFDIYKHYVKNRSYLIKIKKDINTNKCILFFHGSRDLHWDCALNSTNMLTEEYITVYLQGTNQGIFQLEKPYIHNYGYISYGENFFEIRDYTDNFIDDIDYVKEVKKDLIKRYRFSNFYAVGHSNGGVFVCLFPIYLPNEFIAIVSHEGGMGYDEYFNIPFDKLDDSIKPKMLFYTGTTDIHKDPCIQAHRIFTNEGFNSSIYIEDGLSHNYSSNCENYIYNFLNSC